jgi:GH15 family glucan-1,4-alpha-glucosidase
MKNIYNTLSDAFESANIDELDYEKTVIGGYQIVITRRNTQNTQSLIIVLDLDITNRLYDVVYINTLLTNTQMNNFIHVFDEQIEA